MRTVLKAAAIAAVLVASMSMSPSFAQQGQGSNEATGYAQSWAAANRGVPASFGAYAQYGHARDFRR